MKAPFGLDLVVAILGTLGALLLLVAAFAAVAQGADPVTDRLTVRLADWAEGLFTTANDGDGRDADPSDPGGRSP